MLCNLSTPFCGLGPAAGRCIFSKHTLPLAHIQYRGLLGQRAEGLAGLAHTL